jgi:serine/threonine protein kinase
MSELKLQQCRLDGRYDILECLGRGSYAEVYLARDAAASGSSPQMVVIKALNLLLQGAIDLDLEHTLIENFRNEAVALDRVRHPNIINRLGHGTAIDLANTTFHYLVLEYLPGGDMAALCRNHPLALDRSLYYLDQICDGLAYAHEHEVIHRDIKPQNLLLTADREIVKIADFGVAKIEATEGLITRVGTDVYAAPEHHPLAQAGVFGTGSLVSPVTQLTPAADVYSLAKTAYMLLTGEAPRRFSQRPITELPAPMDSAPWASFVIRVLRRATETNPAKRYQNVRDFWNELSDATDAEDAIVDAA